MSLPPADGGGAAPPPLSRHEVHLWRAELVRGPAATRALRDLLAPDEERRATRFRFAADRRRWVVARGQLRRLLSAYLDRPAGDVDLVYGPNGKPALPRGEGDGLRFNLSHSGDIALYAFTRSRRVGVDVEREAHVRDLSGTAERFFSSRENRALHALDPSERERGFLACWTRKEAFLKATGRGLSVPLDSFDVSLDPDGPARLLAVRHPPSRESTWSLRDAGPRGRYVGAVAAEGGDGWRLRRLALDPGGLRPG